MLNVRNVLLLAKQTQVHTEETRGVSMEVTQNYTKKPEMPPVTFVVSLCKIHALLFSKIADVHDVRTRKSVCFRKIFRFPLHLLPNSTFASERPQVRTWGGKLVSCSRRHLTSLRSLHDAHHDCLTKMAKFVYINTRPSAANYQSQKF